jgi:hypothetical protein
MNVSINLSSEMEAVLRRRASAAGTDVATVIQELVNERLAEEKTEPIKSGSHAEFMAKLQRVIEIHPASNGSLDDSRDSIYGESGQ